MNMRPNFIDRDGYLGWLHTWKVAYTRLSEDIRRQKIDAKIAQRSGASREQQRALHFSRRTAWKMMTLLEEAKIRMKRIREMIREIADQPFPLVIDDVRNVDFHYNTGHSQFSFLPLWVVRAKGRSYYVNEVDFDVACTTKERASGSTKGVLRFKRCSIEIDGEGNARLGAYRATSSKILVDERA